MQLAHKLSLSFQKCALLSLKTADATSKRSMSLKGPCHGFRNQWGPVPDPSQQHRDENSKRAGETDDRLQSTGCTCSAGNPHIALNKPTFYFAHDFLTFLIYSCYKKGFSKLVTAAADSMTVKSWILNKMRLKTPRMCEHLYLRMISISITLFITSFSFQVSAPIADEFTFPVICERISNAELLIDESILGMCVCVCVCVHL